MKGGDKVDSIFIIIKIIQEHSSTYEYSSGSVGWAMRGSHFGCEKRVEFHSAYATEKEASDVLEKLKLAYESNSYSNIYNDGYSWGIGYECSGFLIKELHSGREINFLL